MSDAIIETHASAVLEQTPFAIPSKQLVIWLFIISDAVTFGAVLFAYGYIKNASTDWPEPFKFSLSIINVILMPGLRLALIPAAIFVLLMMSMIWSDSFRLLHMRTFAK